VIGALRVLRHHIADPRLRSAIQTSAMASAGLMLAATLPLARGALTDTTLTAVAAASFSVLALTRVDSFWLTLAAGLTGILRFTVGIIGREGG
jgi:chromate transporter